MKFRIFSAAALTICGAAPVLAQTQNAELLGNMAGLRTVLGSYGATLGVNDSENLLGNISGGVKQGATLQGVMTAVLKLDTAKAFGLPGGTLNVSALQIHGRPLTPYYLDDLQGANGNEADDATRLWELWYDQTFDAARVDIKAGQQSIDNEFMVSQNSALFINTMAGWPLIPSDDLYGGGPAYPQSSLGARIEYKLNDNMTMLAGVFDDNPPGGRFDDDPQSKDAGGVRFNLNTGALYIAELQYAKTSALPGSYKIGFWYDSGSFPDQEFGTDGLSLANPESNGKPLMHHGDYSFYGIIDQTIWQPSKTQAVSLFGRIMGAPDDRNLIGFSFNGGATLTAPLPGRDNDLAGINFDIGKVSGAAAGLDRDTAYYMQTAYPVRGTEALIELTYQAQVTPWLQLQPDVQYVVNPGAGLQNPDGTAHILRNEFVAGIRAVTTF